MSFHLSSLVSVSSSWAEPSWSGKTERCQSRDLSEVRVRRDHLKVMPDAKLGEQPVYGADLNAFAATLIAKVGGGDVVVSIRHHQRD